MSKPYIALLMCLALAPSPAPAQAASVPTETLKAFQVFEEATQQLSKAKSAMVAVETGEKPQGDSEDWAGAIRGYELAAEAIKKSAGPSVPDVSGYGVPHDQLKSCATRQGALAKIDRQLKSLYAAGQQASETRAVLKNRLDVAHTAEETRRYLVRGATKLASAPLLAEVFTWSWRDLETPLAKSIAAYAGEIKRFQDRVERGHGEIKSRSATLAGQAEAYGGAKDCLLAGSWAGSRTVAGSMAGLTLQLTSSGTAWSGSGNFDGATVPVRSVSISGSTVSISFGGGKASMKGTLSGDGRNYHGTFSSMDGPGSFTLRKQ